MSDPLQRPAMFGGPLARPVPGDPYSTRGAIYDAVPIGPRVTDPPYPTTVGQGVFTQPGIPQVPYAVPLPMPFATGPTPGITPQAGVGSQVNPTGPQIMPQTK